jgi:hypothetical protein
VGSILNEYPKITPHHCKTEAKAKANGSRKTTRRLAGDAAAAAKEGSEKRNQRRTQPGMISACLQKPFYYVLPKFASRRKKEFLTFFF